ncbi:MAG: hypothetical protein LRY71_14470, partial [Bacillaceae bacterium]|nr:hypothetical protein [Bacillaceae bacterium]
KDPPGYFFAIFSPAHSAAVFPHKIQKSNFLIKKLGCSVFPIYFMDLKVHITEKDDNVKNNIAKKRI